MGKLRHFLKHTIRISWQPPPTLPSYMCRLERESLDEFGMDMNGEIEAHVKGYVGGMMLRQVGSKCTRN